MKILVIEIDYKYVKLIIIADKGAVAHSLKRQPHNFI